MIMKNIVKLSLIFVLTLVFPVLASAQDKGDRQQWEKELTKYKHEYMTKELKLSEEQQEKFFKVYDAMANELRSATSQTRKFCKEVEKWGVKATALELEKAAQAQFELKGRESAIEMKYYPKFKETLTPQQLFKLKKVERHFTRKMVKQHNKMKSDKKK